MGQSININDLAAEISRDLADYSTEVHEKLIHDKLFIAKSAVAKLRQGGPFKEHTGDYAKGWGYTKRGNNYVVHNKTDYQLTHLLENGHATRNGGRTRAFVHIRPVDDWVIAAFEAKLKEDLSK
ncbi:HK97 gp10 family phage protein [Oenococcus sp.]|uniref:HK97 gp10 family phage protein n=1 Tax=Oenococcus sp. TaxID=1979414 RepID=UPI0039EAAC23